MDCLLEIFRQLGASLDMGETLATLDAELRRLIPYDTLSVHWLEEGRLIPIYAAGPDSQVLAALEIAAGEGLLGEVAATRRAVCNGVLEPLDGLTATLALPITLPGGGIAVLALFRGAQTPFVPEDVAALTALAPKLAASMHNARRFARVQGACARALFERLDAEIARARRMGDRLAVLECGVTALDPEGARAGKIAAELRRLCREYDFIVPSGDAFVVVLAGFAPEGLAEKQARIEAVFESHGLTPAIGAAFLPEDGVDTEAIRASNLTEQDFIFTSLHIYDQTQHDLEACLAVL